MPTPSRANPHTAEYITLRDYIDTRVSSIDKAVELAYEQMDTRLQGMNEFRQSLRDQGNTFLTKAEFYTWKDKVDEDIRLLRETRAELAGKASQGTAILAILISVSGLLIGLIGLWASLH